MEKSMKNLLMIVTLITLLFTGRVIAAVYPGGATATFIGNSLDPFPVISGLSPSQASGRTYYQYDTGNKYIYSGTAWKLLTGFEETALGTLEAPGVTDSISYKGCSAYTFTITVADINTSVTVRVEGWSEEEGTWVNMHTLGEDTVITANGSYKLFYEGEDPILLRFNFVSEAGGTDATISVLFAKVKVR
jgi:hypothetical protein